MATSTPMGLLTPSNAQTTYSYAEDLDIVDHLGYDDVDDDVEKAHQNRESHLRELFLSEKNYVETLQLLKKCYLEPLRAEAKNQARKFLGMQKMVCTDNEVHALFSNLESILDIHQAMLCQLDERFSRLWGPTQITWDIFQQAFPRLTAYDQYTRDFSNAMATYQRLIKMTPFRKFIESCQKDSRSKGIGFLQLLKEPTQRISEYANLIPLIVADTPPMHPDYGGLRAARKCISSISGHLEERVAECNNLWQIAYLQSTIQNLPNIFSPTRKLILRGNLYRVNSHTQSLNPNVAFLLEPRTYLLFSDMLIFCKAKGDGGLLHYKGTVELRNMEIRVRQYKETAQFNVLELSSTNSMADEWTANALVPIHTHAIRCANQEQHQEWYHMLKNVLADVNKTAIAITANGSEQTYSIKRTSTMTSLVSMNSTSTRSTRSTDDGHHSTAIRTPSTPTTYSMPFDLQSIPKRSHDTIAVPPSPRQAPPNSVGGIYGGGFGLEGS